MEAILHISFITVIFLNVWLLATSIIKKWKQSKSVSHWSRMMPQLWLFPKTQSQKDTCSLPGTTRYWKYSRDSASTLEHIQARHKTEAEGGGKIRAKSHFQVSNSIYTYISHTVVSVCQNLMKLTAKQSDRNKENLTLFVKDREIDVKIVLFKAFSECFSAYRGLPSSIMLTCVQLAFRLEIDSFREHRFYYLLQIQYQFYSTWHYSLNLRFWTKEVAFWCLKSESDIWQTRVLHETSSKLTLPSVLSLLGKPNKQPNKNKNTHKNKQTEKQTCKGIYIFFFYYFKFYSWKPHEATWRDGKQWVQ